MALCANPIEPQARRYSHYVPQDARPTGLPEEAELKAKVDALAAGK